MANIRKRSRLFRFGYELVDRFIRDDVSGMAAQLAYYFLLSLFPFFIFAFTLIGYLPISTENALTIIQIVAPEKVTELLEDNLHSFLNTRRGWLLFLSLAGTLWTSSSAIHAIIVALNRAYDVADERSYFMSRLLAILFTIGIVIAIFMTLLLPVFGKTIEVFFTSRIHVPDYILLIWYLLRWVVSLMFLISLFAFLYYFAPNCDVNWKVAIVGALFAGLGWLGVSYGFSYYVNNFSNYSLTYGSLGGVIILMIWFYLSALILILGGHINALIQKYTNGRL
ncbi:YihY/virulence factor BrkB family protein [Aneurinibacillus aneurinilyticus]|jgi:membrane protein|uniref:YihY family protein n=1 Tax=Aneurinibacillus aneurinilyticus ATCC 12856 TaxID=649747 RepID=U1YGD2_ANEAE|nr:YihY/virulence factor BrkB family protein [Aneurinibacillus aneurinilyticus]ERI11142.1 YihY family protein [Aneurinibacillus aneurinilyticus ATCC 12856]MCI1695008.1 YihY/virulence factor BrkB family protein [Aneurinibacillus aneurinilyticus]MED0673452.1 YihY/virulence factor BrkB family protein [Aneurinibacillus aneurinilyticus]MED0709285.1 YihY/virulence factor BrkB family protein [Aneurinibacillus aneurinilyticus]MED0723558.1 YihY/virulence factor BrkB family protein [Aneurinibacillus ane